MPAVFEYERIVRSEEIDPQGHANNVAFVQWMQEAALAHSEAQGWPTARYRREGYSWVARSHFIEYRLPAFEGERIIVRTWVAAMNRVSSPRRYQIVRAVDDALLAAAETNWAFVSIGDNRLARIPAEVAEAFEIVDRDPKR
jgi:acyl-CoA thioester hydrolase